MFRILLGQEANHFTARYKDVISKGATEMQTGFEVKAEYDFQASEQLKNDIISLGQTITASVPVVWIINDEEISKDGFLNISGGTEYEAGFNYVEAILNSFIEEPEGTYKVKVKVPEIVEGDIKFCVYQYNPEEDYYTDLVGCYNTYNEAKQQASQCDCIVTGESDNIVASGDTEIDLGTITLGGKKAPGKPPEKEPSWYPGKYVREILEKIIGKG